MYESNLMLRIKYIFHEIFTYIVLLYVLYFGVVFLCHHDFVEQSSLFALHLTLVRLG